MDKRYQQLQPEERPTIASLRQQVSSMRAMPRMLGRTPSTVSHELARNCEAQKVDLSDRAYKTLVSIG